MRGLIRRAAVAAVAYLGLLLFAADDLGSVPVPGPVAGGVIQSSDRLGIPANGSWTRSGSVQTGSAGKERK
jgi:hypothetical protein